MANQTWVSRAFAAPGGAAAAVAFLNDPARQGQGEASVITRNDGSAELIFLEPGGLGSAASPSWVYRDFTAAQGEAGAVSFLNEPARQGRGQASAADRADGSVSLFYLEPGSLGSGTSETWVYRNFPGPQGAAAAVTFLNEPDRQGAGEASAFARADGSAGLFFLEPGSLGTSTRQAWAYDNFATAAAAVGFLNDAPKQGPGEACAMLRDDGSVGVFYLEPGTG